MRYDIDINRIPEDTERITVTDAAQQFTAAQCTSNNKSVVAALVTCESNPVRFCLGGSTPTQGSSGLGHILEIGQSIMLTNPAAVKTFSFINHTNGDTAYLQVTFEFAIGA